MKRIVSTVIVLLMVSLMTACGGNSASPSDTGYTADVFRINCGVSYGSVVTQIIKLHGLLDGKLPDGVSIEWSYIESSSNVRDALSAKQVDIAVASIPTIIAAIENGAPIAVLSNSAAQSAYVFSNNPDIKSLDDIGPTHKISSSTLGGTYGLAFMMVCKEIYGDAQKFSQNFLTMSNSDTLISLASSKEIDCAILGFPSLAEARKMENLTPIYDLLPVMRENSLTQINVASQEFAESNPVLVQAFLDASQEAMDFLNDNPEEAAALLSQQYGDVAPSEIEEQIKGVPFTLEISETAYDSVAQLMHETGILSNPPKKFSELPNYDSIRKAP